jgi:ribosomal protein S18 acetylase RimI-like enzyme
MHIRRVRVDEAAMRRYVEELWIPYHRDLGESIDTHQLNDNVDVESVVEHHSNLFDGPDRRLWVALDEVDDETAPLASVDATFAGFLSVVLEASPDQFESPDRLILGDFYLTESYRGSGLADELVARAAQAAREDGCEQLALDVDIDNERARAFYEKLGFDVGRYRMRVPVDELQLDTESD